MARVNSPYGGMVHLNGNLLCAVDVETTGIKAGTHDLVQVAVLPLDSNIKPIKSIMPFYMNLTPTRLDNIDYKACKVNKLTLSQMINQSMDKWKAADLFEEWFERLNLPVAASHHKKLMPLWSNGSFDKSFLKEWLGDEGYDYFFHFHERDTQALALSINDRFYQMSEKLPFPKVGLNAIAAQFNIVNENAHDALSDCITTAEVYRQMLLMYQPVIPQSAPFTQEISCEDSSPESATPSQCSSSQCSSPSS